MANLIKLRKGLDINLKGKAAAEVVAVKEPGTWGKTQGDEHHRAGCYGTGL